MSDTQVGIVWNPSKTTREDLEAALSDIDRARVSWFETSREDPGQDATRRALDAGAELILATGGDGTIRAVAEHLAEMKSATELGIIPLGTGNLLARNLGVPLNDLPAAVTRALHGAARPIEIGGHVTLAEGSERHAFAVMAGFGIDAHMITETDENLKDKAGWLAYVDGRAVSASEVIDLRLAVDGADPVDERAHTLIIGNCGTLQAGINLLPDADPGDGELDLLALHADGMTGWVDTLRTMVWDNGLRRILRGSGDHERAQSSDSTTDRRLTTLTIELGEPRSFEVDGDDLGEATRIEISVQPAAIRVR